MAPVEGVPMRVALFLLAATFVALAGASMFVAVHAVSPKGHP